MLAERHTHAGARGTSSLAPRMLARVYSSLVPTGLVAAPDQAHNGRRCREDHADGPPLPPER